MAEAEEAKFQLTAPAPLPLYAARPKSTSKLQAASAHTPKQDIFGEVIQKTPEQEELVPEWACDLDAILTELADDGITMVCVTHEMGFAKKVADRVIFMDEGQIVEENSPHEFFDNPQSDRLKMFLEQILDH